MAADMVLQVLVSPLLGTVFNNLSSLIQSEIGQVWGVKKELEKLSNTISTIRDVMEDAEEKQLQDKPLNNWLKRLKEVVYDAEDVLEEFAIEDAIRRDRNSKIIETKYNPCSNIQVLTDFVSSSCFDIKHVLFRRKIVKQIKDLKNKFDEIAEERSKFLLNLNSVKKEVRVVQTSSIPVEEHIYGRDEDKKHLVNLLLNIIELYGDRQRGDVFVCTIHGMGGLGKTTLAQMVYNDERILEHFEVRCWVCVSENFDPTTLLKAIIGSSGASAHDLEDLDPLQRRLQEILSGKRFLVVLDDVWNEDQAKWDILKSFLRCGDRSSSVLVTTRLRTVAAIMGTLHLYSPTILSDDDCWPLFKHRAFDITNNEVMNHPNLEAIGKEIVKKCKGVPLAAKALGGLLRFKREENEWIFVRDSEVWTLPQHAQDSILPALKLSYNHLPSHLKQCFAYCAIFPKDHRIDKEGLVNLWIANGFIQSRGERMELEDVGNEIFNDLLWTSFFQVYEKDGFGNIISCMMHDLVHDLACSIMRDECSVAMVGKVVSVSRSSTSTTRHFSFDFSYSPPYILNESSLPNTLTHIRTFLSLIHPYRHATIKLVISLQLIFSNLKCLRVLDLSGADIETIPDSIRNLKHLRYLNLSKTYIRSLPNEPFCSLRNLQILRLSTCVHLQMLPEDLWKMSSLRYLNIEYCNELTRMAIGMGKLTSLKSLSHFIVGSETGYGIEELQGLDQLRGELKIEAVEQVRSITNARNANLMRKPYLTSLELIWRMENNNNISTEEEELLLGIGEGLQPHPNIKQLRIAGYLCSKFPSWMMIPYSCLPNLVKIELQGCRRCEHLPSLGKLTLLKHLTIREMDSVKCIRDEFYYNGDSDRHHHHQGYFPSLEELTIFEMPNLEEWSSPSSSSSSNQDNIIRGGEGTVMMRPQNLTSLKRLTIYSCPKLRNLPKMLMENLKSLTYLSISGPAASVSLAEEGIMQNLKSLEDLVIWNCYCLKTLGEGIKHLTTLKDLRIIDCSELELLPDDFQHLTVLRSLRLSHLPKMTSLPTLNSQHLRSTLQILGITDCSSLTTLPGWLTDLASLRRLYFDNCVNLRYWPEGFQRLTALNHLSVGRCHPDFHSQCERYKQDNSHQIDEIFINGQKL